MNNSICTLFDNILIDIHKFKSLLYKRHREKSSKQLSNTTSWEYEKENTIDSDSWSDPYGDERAYYDGWSREDVESGLADAYE